MYAGPEDGETAGVARLGALLLAPFVGGLLAGEAVGEGRAGLGEGPLLAPREK